MKFLVTVVGMFIMVGGTTQVTIAEYPRQFSCQIDATSDIPIPEAQSTCGNVRHTIDERLYSGGCLGNLVRTITYTDDCGNKAVAEQYISLTDNDPPFVYGPLVTSVILKPGEQVPPPVAPAARDNSGQDVEVRLEESTEKGVIIRNWVFSDRCGNESRAQQLISFE